MLITLVIALPLLVVILVGGEFGFRAYATGQIEKSVQTSLPPGVTGTVDARIQGFSSLWQWLHGHFDHVTLTTDKLTINGAAASAQIEAYGLPVSGNGPVQSATGTLTVSQNALKNLSALKDAGASAPKIGEGTVSTTVVKTILTIPITVSVTLVPSLRGKYVHLTPTHAELQSGGLSVPGTALIKALLPDGISVCSAEYLPPSMEITTIEAHPGKAVVTFIGTKLDLATLGTETGHCT